MKNKKIIVLGAAVLLLLVIIIFVTVFPRNKAYIETELDKYRSDIGTVILQYELNNNVKLNYEIETHKDSNIYTIECIAKDDYTKNICNGNDKVMMWIKVDQKTFKMKMAGGYDCFEDTIYNVTKKH